MLVDKGFFSYIGIVKGLCSLINHQKDNCRLPRPMDSHENLGQFRFDGL